MIKKSISFILAIIILFAFVGCVGCNENNDKNNDKNADSTTDTQDDNVTEGEETTLLNAYKSIECVPSSGASALYISSGDSDMTYKLSIPNNWELLLEENVLNIYRNNEIIGYVSSEKEEFSDYSCVYTNGSVEGGIDVEYRIYGKENKDVYEYFRYFIYSKDDRQLFVRVDYAELDKFSASRIQFNVQLIEAVTSSDIGMSRLSDSIISEGANITILGNSFIRSSAIGTILDDMCDGIHNIQATSIGYATVSGTYSVDSSLINQIESGEIDALFMCGFYDEADANAFKVIVEACKKSNTKLFIFPAHNESSYSINKAVENYEYPMYLNWKGEIDDLINTGISKSDFCVDDSHNHSTPLAGYVGAHMIYRVLFGEIPPALNEYTGFTQEYVDGKLGDYSETGTIVKVEPSKIIMLS